jgi:hypothetical protein
MVIKICNINWDLLFALFILGTTLLRIYMLVAKYRLSSHVDNYKYSKHGGDGKHEVVRTTISSLNTICKG